MNYVGMDIHAAKADAQSNGKQLRIIANDHHTLRYAEQPDAEHVMVWVKNGKVTKMAIAGEYSQA
jgi:hypothetical protein